MRLVGNMMIEVYHLTFSILSMRSAGNVGSFELGCPAFHTSKTCGLNFLLA